MAMGVYKASAKHLNKHQLQKYIKAKPYLFLGDLRFNKYSIFFQTVLIVRVCLLSDLRS